MSALGYNQVLMLSGADLGTTVEVWGSETDPSFNGFPAKIHAGRLVSVLHEQDLPCVLTLIDAHGAWLEITALPT